MKRKARVSGGDLAAKLSTALDPESQRARDDARADRSFENTLVITLTQQLRDTQALLESLCTQNTVLQNRVHDLEHANDCAMMRAELMSELTQRSEPNRGCTRLPSPPCYRRSRKNEPGIDRVDGKIRCEYIYPNGGAMTYWLSDPSTDNYDYEYNENDNPFEPSYKSLFRPLCAPHKSRSHSRNSRALSCRRSPTPSPSRLHNQVLASPEHPTPSVNGNAVELVVMPHRRDSVTYIISPAPKE
jgi:hypothetical protein